MSCSEKDFNLEKGPKLFSAIRRSAVDEMIHLNAFKCI